MSNTSLTIKVPGKLMIAGEYAVLSTGYPAIVTAVNRYIIIEINQSNRNKISYPDSKIPEVTWTLDHNGGVAGLDGKEYSFMKEAITITYELLKEKGVIMAPFHLQIASELYDPMTGKKYGLGSSAAIVVGVICAILAFHEEGTERDPLKLYKLACIAHFKSQGNGSGADIAAAVFGGWLSYYRYDSSWLIHELKYQNESMVNLINMPWPNLRIEKINLPGEVRLVAGWTKHSAKTAPMVDQIEIFQKQQGKLYEIFLNRSKAAVNEFIRSCELSDGTGILNAIHNNRTALQYLSETTGIQIETKEIRKLCSIADRYGRGKSSGAGGGDCGIAFLLGDDGLEALKQEWEQAGIIPLDFLAGILCLEMLS